MGLINMVAIPMYRTINDYGDNISDVNKYLYAIRDSTIVYNPYFLILFGIFVVFTVSSYYAQIKLLGNQRFFNSFLAGSFSTFLVSIFFAMGEYINILDMMFFIAVSGIAFALCWFYRD